MSKLSTALIVVLIGVSKLFADSSAPSAPLKEGERASASFPSLNEHNPFFPPGYSPAQPKPEAKPVAPAKPQLGDSEFLSLHSIIKNGEGSYIFSIYDKRTDDSQWVGLRETDAKWFVERYNPEESSIWVKNEGRVVLTKSELSGGRKNRNNNPTRARPRNTGRNSGRSGGGRGRPPADYDAETEELLRLLLE